MKKTFKTIAVLIITMCALMATGCQQPAGNNPSGEQFTYLKPGENIPYLNPIVGKVYSSDYDSFVIQKDSQNNYHLYYGNKTEAEQFLADINSYASNTTATIGTIISTKDAVTAPDGGIVVLLKTDKHTNYGPAPAYTPNTHSNCYIPVYISINSEIKMSQYYYSGVADFSTKEKGSANMNYSSAIYGSASTYNGATE